MFNDNEPIMPPKPPVPPAPMSPAPIKATPPASMPSTPVTVKTGSKAMSLVLPIVMLIVGLLVAAAGTYYWQSSAKNQALTEAQSKFDLEKADLKTANDLLQKTLDNKDVELTTLKTTTPLPSISIVSSADNKTITIKNDTTEIKTLTFDSAQRIRILKQTESTVYLVQEPIVPGGRGSNYQLAVIQKLYTYNVRDNSFTEITVPQSNVTFYDISSNGELIAYKSVNTIYTYNTATKLNAEFNVPVNYRSETIGGTTAPGERNGDIGDLTLSPDGKKIAFAGVSDNKVSSAVFIIDIANNIMSKIIEKPGIIYHVKGWIGNADSDLEYYYFK